MVTAQAVAHRLNSLQHNTPEFVNSYFGASPDNWQLEAMRAYDAGKNISIRSGHGPGKTTLLSWFVIHKLACCPYAKIPCTAPTGHQLRDLLWAEISYWLNRSALKHLLTWNATSVTPVGYEESWFAVARSCAKPEALAGFHAPHILYVVDEASGVPNNIFEAIEGALTTPNAQMVMASNPTQRTGYFYDSHTKNRAEWTTIHISSKDSIRVESDWVERMARTWGVDSDIFRVRVLGEFPDADAKGFISLSSVEAAIQRWHDAEASGVITIGLDVARFGADETVFCVRQGYKVLELRAFRGLAVTETVGHAVDIARQYAAQCINVDDSGVGGGVTDLLRAFRPCAINACNFGAAGNEHYDNASSMWMGTIKEALRLNQLALPDDDDLIAQLTSRRYSMRPNGKIRLESKDEMKRSPRLLPSPDRADALCLAFAPRKRLIKVSVGGERKNITQYKPR